MKMHKSLFCILLVLILILGINIGHASESFVSSIFTKNQLSAEQWFQDESTRAACTVFTAIGITKNDDLIFEDLEDYTTNPSWIGISKSKKQLITIGYLGISKITVYIAVITPKTGEIEYMTMDMSSSNNKEDIPKIIKSLIPSILEAQYATSEYCENDPTQISYIMNQLYGN